MANRPSNEVTVEYIMIADMKRSLSLSQTEIGMGVSIANQISNPEIRQNGARCVDVNVNVNVNDRRMQDMNRIFAKNVFLMTVLDKESRTLYAEKVNTAKIDLKLSEDKKESTEEVEVPYEGK